MEEVERERKRMKAVVKLQERAFLQPGPSNFGVGGRKKEESSREE